MSFNLTLRVVGMAIFAAAGYLLGLFLDQMLYEGTRPNAFSQLVLPLVIISALLGFVVTPFITIYPLRWVRNRLRMMPALDLMAATVGLSTGILLGALLTWPLSNLPGWPGRPAPTV